MSALRKSLKAIFVSPFTGLKKGPTQGTNKHVTVEQPSEIPIISTRAAARPTTPTNSPTTAKTPTPTDLPRNARPTTLQSSEIDDLRNDLSNDKEFNPE